MKRITEIGIALIVVTCMAGCMSPGGAVITGPLSYMSSKHIDKAKMVRSALISNRIPQEKKDVVVRAVNMSMGPGEIAAGYQVDVLALFSSDYTGGELFLQTLAATGDLAAEAAAGWALYDAFKTDSHDSGIKINNNNYGSNNRNYTSINQGSGYSAQPNDGAATGDLNVQN